MFDEAEDCILHLMWFNQCWLVVQNYSSEDHAYGKHGVTHSMFTFREYSRPNYTNPWSLSLEREYDCLEQVFVHFLKRGLDFAKYSMIALLDHREMNDEFPSKLN